MKKANKFIALLLATLLMITAFAVCVLAEGETSDPTNEGAPTESNPEAPDNGEGSTPDGETSTPEGGETSNPDNGETSNPDNGETSNPDNGESSTPDPEPDPNAYNVNIVVNGASASAVTVLMNGVTVSGSTYSSSALPLVIQAEANAGYKITAVAFGVVGFAQPLTEADGNFSGSFSNLSAG